MAHLWHPVENQVELRKIRAHREISKIPRNSGFYGFPIQIIRGNLPKIEFVSSTLRFTILGLFSCITGFLEIWGSWGLLFLQLCLRAWGTSCPPISQGAASYLIGDGSPLGGPVPIEEGAVAWGCEGRTYCRYEGRLIKGTAKQVPTGCYAPSVR